MIRTLYVLRRLVDRLDMYFKYVDSVWGNISYADGSMECFVVEPHKIYHYPIGFMLMVVI